MKPWRPDRYQRWKQTWKGDRHDNAREWNDDSCEAPEVTQHNRDFPHNKVYRAPPLQKERVTWWLAK